MLSVRGGGGREGRWRPSSSTISDRSAVCRAAGRQLVAEPPTVPEERVHGEAALGRTAVGRPTRCWSETSRTALPGVANDCVGNECLLSLAQAEPLGGCGDQADAVIGKAHRTPGPAAAAVKEPMAEDDAGVAVPENRRPRGGWIRRALGSVTVEPVIFFYMFAFMLTSVVEQAFYVDRACRVNLNLSDTTCSRIHDPEFKGELDRVQVGTLPRASWPQAKTDQRQSDSLVGILFFRWRCRPFTSTTVSPRTRCRSSLHCSWAHGATAADASCPYCWGCSARRTTSLCSPWCPRRVRRCFRTGECTQIAWGCFRGCLRKK